MLFKNCLQTIDYFLIWDLYRHGLFLQIPLYRFCYTTTLICFFQLEKKPLLPWQVKAVSLVEVRRLELRASWSQRGIQRFFSWETALSSPFRSENGALRRSCLHCLRVFRRRIWSDMWSKRLPPKQVFLSAGVCCMVTLGGGKVKWFFAGGSEFGTEETRKDRFSANRWFYSKLRL